MWRCGDENEGVADRVRVVMGGRRVLQNGGTKAVQPCGKRLGEEEHHVPGVCDVWVSVVSECVTGCGRWL